MNIPSLETRLTTWKILVIDDDEDDYFIAREMLKDAKGRKFNVHWANTFSAGRTALFSDHFDAVLVDYDLGAQTGIELIREATDQGYPSPMILFTGRGNYEVDVEALQAGATMYLTKGEANPLLLERAIRYAVERKESEEALRQARNEARSQEKLLQERNEALQRSEEKFARSFRGSPIAIAISTVADGRFLEVNDSYTRLLGFSQEELIGHTSIELGMFPNPEDRKAITRLFRSGGGFRDYELRLWSKSGEPRDVLFSTEPIEIDGQECMLSIVVDFTARKQAELSLRASEAHLRESEERFRVLFHNRHSPMLLIDPATAQIVDANPAASLFYGWSQEDLTGMRITDINALTPDQTHVEMNSALATSTSKQFTFRHRLASGEIRDVEVNSGPIQIGTKEYLFSIIHDITERKQAEQAIRDMEVQRRLLENRELERQQLARELQDGPVQDLSSLLFNLQLIKAGGAEQDVQENLDKVSQRLKDTVQDLRTMINELRPSNLSSC